MQAVLQTVLHAIDDEAGSKHIAGKTSAALKRKNRTLARELFLLFSVKVLM